jgi:hypothetical protein
MTITDSSSGDRNGCFRGDGCLEDVWFGNPLLVDDLGDIFVTSEGDTVRFRGSDSLTDLVNLLETIFVGESKESEVTLSFILLLRKASLGAAESVV